MVMTARDNIEVVPDYRVPVGDFINPNRSVPMPTPRVLNEGATNLIEGNPGTLESTQDSAARAPSAGSGWSQPNGDWKDNNPPAPEPRWNGTNSGPMPPATASSHPALR